MSLDGPIGPSCSIACGSGGSDTMKDSLNLTTQAGKHAPTGHQLHSIHPTMKTQTHDLRFSPSIRRSAGRHIPSLLPLPLIASLFLFLLQPFAGQSVTAQTLGASKTSTFWVDGTSTLHDWTIETHTVGGTVTERDGVIRNVSLSIPVNTLKSGKSGMDDKVYDALDVKKHPEITIKASDVTFTGDEADVRAEVTVKGMTRTMPLKVTRRESGGAIVFSGSTGFKMTDFKVTPPQAMLGAVKAGDEIVVRFELHMAPKAN